MPLSPTKLEPGEAYASVEDILLASDLPEMIVRVPRWKRNGASLALRVKALSLVQKEAVLRESRRPDGTIDTIVYTEATIREGVMIPRFDANTAERLRLKNPTDLDLIVQTIWTLSALDQDIIDAVVTEQTGAAPPEPPEPPAGA